MPVEWYVKNNLNTEARRMASSLEDAARALRNKDFDRAGRELDDAATHMKRLANVFKQI